MVIFDPRLQDSRARDIICLSASMSNRESTFQKRPFVHELNETYRGEIRLISQIDRIDWMAGARAQMESILL